jgi:hypothetical protein
MVEKLLKRLIFYGNSFGSSLILWAQGILSLRDPKANPLAYTAS